MKKFLLSLASIALCGSMFAESYDITWKPADGATGYPYEMGKVGGTSTTGNLGTTLTNKGDYLKVTAEGFVFYMVKAGKGNAPLYNSKGDIRCYAENTLQITAPAGQRILDIDFVLSTDGKKQTAKITADTGTMGNQTIGGTNVTWSGSATDITFTVGGSNEYGSNTDRSKFGQFYFNEVKITTVEDSKETPVLAFEPATITTDFGAEFAQPVFTSTPEGIEVTFTSSDENVATYTAEGGLVLTGIGSAVITAEFAGNDTYNPASATLTVKVTDPNEIYGSPMGEDFTFDNGENTYPWSHTDQYGLKGSAYIKPVSNNTTGYAISPVIDLTGWKSATLKFDQALNQYKLNGNNIEDLSVINTTYAFISVREEGATEWTDLEAAVTNPAELSWDFFANDPVDLSAYVGKKIEVAFKYVSEGDVAGTWEIKNISVTGEKAPAPEIPTLMVAGEVETGESIEVKEEGSEISFPEVEGVSVYYKWEPASETPALFAETTEDGFTLYTEPVTINTTGKLSYYAESYGVKTDVKTVNVTVAVGIEGVEAAEDAEAVYYNLQGVRVANPENGIFVKAQGGKYTKVVK